MKLVKVAAEEIHLPATCSMTGRALAPLAEVWTVLRALGVAPYVFDKTGNLHILKWCSAPAMLTVTTAAYLTVATVAGVVGLMMTVATPPVFHTTEQEVNFIWQMMFVVLFGSMLLNAWSQTMSLLFAGHRFCGLLNSWLDMATWGDMDRGKGLKIRVRLQVAFTIGVAAAILGCALAGFPYMLLLGLDGVASILFIVPFHWLGTSPFSTKVNRLSCLRMHLRVKLYPRKLKINLLNHVTYTLRCHCIKIYLSNLCTKEMYL